MNNIPRTLLEKHIRFAAPLLSGRLLNAGCGDNTYENLYADRVDSIVRLDWPKTIHNADAIDVFGDIASLPFTNNSFDSILCTEVLEHVFRPQQVLNEFGRVLKPGGCLVLSTPFLYPVHEGPYDFHRYTYFALENLLVSAGFTIRYAYARGGIGAVVLFFMRKFFLRCVQFAIGHTLAGLLPWLWLDRCYLFFGGKKITNQSAALASYTLGYTIIAHRSS